MVEVNLLEALMRLRNQKIFLGLLAGMGILCLALGLWIFHLTEKGQASRDRLKEAEQQLKTLQAQPVITPFKESPKEEDVHYHREDKTVSLHLQDKPIKET